GTARQVEAPRLGPVHAELVPVMTGGDMGMATRLDVGVHANRRWGATPTLGDPACGLLFKQVELRRRFDIDEVDAGVERLAGLLALLATAAEDAAPPETPKIPEAIYPTAADHVKATAEPGQQPQNLEVGAGLDGVADGVRQRSEGT